MIQDGAIALDKPTSETSVEELTDIVVNEYRRAREAAHRAPGASSSPPAEGPDRPAGGEQPPGDPQQG
jgi:hypothetical protein